MRPQSIDQPLAHEQSGKDSIAQNHLRIPGAVWPVVGALSLLVSLYVASIPGYVLFHSLAEVFAIVISCAVFTLTWNTRRFLNNNYLLFVGIALLAASVVNSMHTLSYKGMGVIPGQDANLPTQLWIARRYLESIALLSAPCFLRRQLNPWVALAAFGGVTALLLGAIFGHVFPAAYVEGVGLTQFKKVSEYVIAALFLAAAFSLSRQRDHFEPDVIRALTWSLAISAGAELLFTLYTGVYDMPNRLGHFLTIVAYYLIYVAIVKTGIVRPYTLLSSANASLSQREVALRSEVLERKQAQAALSRQSQWLRSLHEIDQAILRAQSPAEIAGATAQTLVAVTEARRAAIVLFNPEEEQMERLGAHGVGLDLPAKSPLGDYWLLRENCQGRTGTIPDVMALPEGDARRAALLTAGIRCYTGVPLMIADQTIGAIVLGHAQPGPLAEEVQEFVRQVAAQLAVAIRQAQLFDEIHRSREQLRTLSHRLVALQEEERKSLSRELHDRAGQSMTSLKIGMGVLRRESEGLPAVQAGIDGLRQMADGVMEELHELAVSLRPSSLDRYGLVPALEQFLAAFQKQNPIEIEFLASGLDQERLPDDVETALYRIVQESLTNVARHAQAKRVGVILSRKNEFVKLILEDDGCGFDVDEALRRGRLGLLGMRERAEMLGGTLTIESSPGCGATVYVEVPAGPSL